MNASFRLALAAALAGGATFLALPAAAAPSYNGCTGFIDSLPTTITTQGTWCLRKDLSTSITSGNAISISANNVTLDCNGFKIGGLAGGDASVANGVLADSRMNITVRGCAIRGFLRGIFLGGMGGGHLVEDNRLDQNLYMGIGTQSMGVTIRRNRVYDTGGSTSIDYIAYGITGGDDISENVVDGVFSTGTANGIGTSTDYAVVDRNTVRGLLAPSGTVYAIRALGLSSAISGNRVLQPSATPGQGIGSSSGFCSGNAVSGFVTAYAGCSRTVGDLSIP